MNRSLYTLLWKLARPLLPLRLRFMAWQNPAYGERSDERFVRRLPPGPSRSKRIWIHAVSVGEVNAAAPLARRLLDAHADLDLLITTTTPTGSDQLKRTFADDLGHRVQHVYAPYDMPRDVERFVRAARPDVAVFMETELWPNTLHVLKQLDVPVVLANARLSERSAKGYRWFSSLIRPAVESLTAVGAQTEQDAERLIGIGVRPETVSVTGSVKFDVSIDAAAQKEADALRARIGDRLVLIAGSTRDTEEGMVLQAFNVVRLTVRNALLILVPRHPERFEQAYRQSVVRGFKVARRSDPAFGDISDSELDVYVGDTMGDLAMLYAVSDVAFVGGSLAELGGQNVLEASAAGVPVLFGPHTFNFKEICEKVEACGAGFRVSDTHDLADETKRLFASPRARSDAARAAATLLAENRGSTERLSQMVQALL